MECARICRRPVYWKPYLPYGSLVAGRSNTLWGVRNVFLAQEDYSRVRPHVVPDACQRDIGDSGKQP